MKKARLLVVAFLMVFAMVGCNKNSEPDKTLSKNKSEKAGQVVALSEAEIGCYVTLGSYEQDNDETNGTEPIEWLVLDVEDGKALLLSRYGLDQVAYYDDYIEHTWEDCEVREWLKNEFYPRAFSEEEKTTIVLSLLENKGAPPSGKVSGCGVTEDYVFCLSYDEAKAYFYEDMEYRYDGETSQEGYCNKNAATSGTEYAKSKGATYDASHYYGDLFEDYDGYCRWWLRTKASDMRVYVVDYKGYFDTTDQGHKPYAYERDVAVRPAMWVTLGE